MLINIPDREYGFISIINACKYSTGIEIGVRNGIYSELLLKYSCLQKLYSIDIQEQHDTKSRLNVFGNRSEFILDSSPECSAKFENESIDFIYIDADHIFEKVYADISSWWPKVKKGGMLCGDDYTHVFNPHEGRYGVVEAVEKFCQENNLEYGVTGTGLNIPQEKERVARGMGKIIEKCLKQELQGIQFGFGDLNDDIRIPQWYIFKL